MFLSKTYKVLVRKFHRNYVSLCLMIMKCDAKFEEKLTLGSKNDMRNLVNFNASSYKIENLNFDMLLLLKAYYV